MAHDNWAVPLADLVLRSLCTHVLENHFLQLDCYSLWCLLLLL